MARLYPALANPMFDVIGPECAHGLAIAALKSGLYPRHRGPDDPMLGVKLFGLTFPNPLGMAAGFDKDAEVADGVLGLGFGFVEVGTVTPKPQTGNPRPRIFRLTRDRAVINRLGFNNAGHEAARVRLERRAARPGVVGVNIGANADSADMIGDYVAGLEVFHGLASYFTINISSPNTPGLRGLQGRKNLSELLRRVMDKRAALAEQTGAATPLLVKIAPDLSEAELGAVVETGLKFKIDGLIVANTTVSRPNLTDANGAQPGGLSGRPLFALSTAMLARVYLAAGGDLPLIGAGGIDSADAAYTKIKAGASLIQLYTGLIFEGHRLIGRIKAGLAAQLAADGHKNVADAVGIEAKTLAGL